jgi:hypothetical protein
MAQLTIDIALGGETKIKVTGHAGPGCKNLTKDIEDALGTVTSDQKTGEYHQAAQQGQQAQAGAK